MVTIRQMLSGLFLVAGAALLLGQNVPGVPTGQTASASGSRSPADADLSASRRISVFYYEQNLNQGLFGEPTPVLIPKLRVAPSQEEKAPAVLSLSTPISDPLADYAFTGIVTLNGRVSALIENTKTREGFYLEIGDSFLSGKILEIEEQQVTLVLNGARRSLARFEDYRLTPLDASAPFLKTGVGRTSMMSSPGQEEPFDSGSEPPPPPDLFPSREYLPPTPEATYGAQAEPKIGSLPQAAEQSPTAEGQYLSPPFFPARMLEK